MCFCIINLVYLNFFTELNFNYEQNEKFINVLDKKKDAKIKSTFYINLLPLTNI